MRAAKPCFSIVNRSRYLTPHQSTFRSLRSDLPLCDMSRDRSEEYSGIIAFANSEKGFQGILKQRYTDFIVREIDPSGAIAQLSNLSGKELENRMFPPRDKPDLAAEALDEFIVSLRALTPADDEKAAALKDFLSLAAARDAECPDAFIVCGSTDKPTRSGVHQLFKLKFKGVVESDTTQVDGVSSIRIQPAFKLKRGWNNRASEAWPATVPNYLRFVVAKENCDTSATVSCLSKYFRCGGDSIRYAGTKDKRGVTFQFMTMYRRKPSDIVVLNKFQFPPTIRVGNFEYVNDQLGLGDLSGNRFEITLRDVNASVSELENMCVALKHSGFVNYFGLQRFGVGGTPNQDIGLAVFQGKWKHAVDLIFADRTGDRPDIIEMKTKYFEGNFKDAVRACPRFMNVERCILEHLSKHGNDHAGAISTVPKASSLMWAHAYQSHVWNKAVTFRIQQLGMQVMEGDLVGEAPARDDGEDEDEPARMTGDGFTRVGTMEASSVQVVTAEDVATNKYSLEDVILPLPGSAVQLPSNAVRQYYEDLLSADGISLSYFKDKAPPQYRMKGTYRRMIQGAHDLTWKIVEYSDPNAEISTTELRSFDLPPQSKKRDREGETEVDDSDAVAKKARVEAASSVESQSGVGDTSVAVPIDLGTGRVGLAINFSLPPGTYATMLLRELTKQSMETQFHSSMTAENAHSTVVSATSASSSTA